MGGFIDAVGDAVNAVISFLGRPFGMYDHEELVTGMQVSGLLTPGVADRGGRNGARRGSGGNASLYYNSYRQFQRKYRKKYSKKFLESLGYSPSSTATTYTATKAKASAWLAANYGYLNTDIHVVEDRYLTNTNMINYSKQKTAGFDPDTGKLVEGGKIYDFIIGTVVNPTTVSMLWRRGYEETITKNLVDNYSYSYENHTVVIGGLVYGLGPFSGEIVNGNYVIVAVRDPIPPETEEVVVEILTPVEEITRSYVDSSFDNEVLWIEYHAVNSGVYEYVEPRDPYTVVYPGGLTDTIVPNGYYKLVSGVGSGNRYVMAAARSLPVYDTVAIDITAIIPMKENNVMTDLNSSKLEKMLKKLNLSGEQLRSSLENPDIDAAYLMSTIDIRINTPVHNKVLFKMFDMISPTQGNISISINQLNMSYLFNITKTEVVGTIGAIGTYSRVLTTGEDATLVLRYQGSRNNYKELVIRNFTQRYTIQGQQFTTLIDATTGYTRLLIPLSIYNSLPYKEWVEIYENSLCLLAYSEKVVFVHWYESGFFAFILQIVAVIIMIIAFVPSGGTSISWGSVLLAMVQSYAVMQVVIEIGKAIGGPLGAAIAVAVAVYMAMRNPGTDGTNATAAWLKPASDGLSVINQVIQHEMDKMVIDYERWMEDASRKYADLKEKMDKFTEDDANDVIISIGQFSDVVWNTPFPSIEQYVNSVVNTESLVDGEWMYDIDAQIAQRNSVRVGV